MEQALNPRVSVRQRGTVEKCNFCHGRWQAALEKAAHDGESAPVQYTPACVEACPAQAIRFGDLNDPDFAAACQNGGTFRLLDSLGTGPKIFYKTTRAEVREATRGFGEVKRG